MLNSNTKLRIKKKPHDDVWYGLDNAANIFPAVSNDRNTNVFRLSCELNESINRAILQKATDKSMKSFAYFQMIMRRGLFWHYLEHTNHSPVVVQESDRPCSRLYYSSIKSLLFEVTYFGCRINLEVFHSISDGSGAFDLLRTIVYNYIIISHEDDFRDNLPALKAASPPSHMAEDSFAHYYDPKEKQSPFREKAYTISGTLLPTDSVKLISADMPVSDVIKLSKAKGVTVTAYLSALMICSIYEGLVPRRLNKRTIGINIPVDLRGHFKSESSRNFFSVVEISYSFGGGHVVFDDVLANVSEQLKLKLKPELLAKRMNYNMSIRKNIIAGVIPLPIKNLILRAAYNKAEQATTCAISNLGRLTMPEQFSKYIKSVHCLLNPTLHHKLKLCVCSFNNRIVMNFTSCIAETKAQTFFIRHLANEGVDITITSNGAYENEIM